MNVPIEMPSCLENALELIQKDRAWVACVVADDDEVHVICSKGTVAEVEKEPDAGRFLPLKADKKDRMAFLISGVRHIARTLSVGRAND